MTVFDQRSERRVAFDLLRARREGAVGLARRQRLHLTALVEHARSASALYRRRFEHCGSDVALRELPPITKPELMAAFDEWVTDPAVTRDGVEAFIADHARIGARYRGAYFVCSTSGITGDPGRFVHDDGAIAVYRALTVRLLFEWLSVRDALALVRRVARWVSLVGTVATSLARGGSSPSDVETPYAGARTVSSPSSGRSTS